MTIKEYFNTSYSILINSIAEEEKVKEESKANEKLWTAGEVREVEGGSFFVILMLRKVLNHDYNNSCKDLAGFVSTQQCRG